MKKFIFFTSLFLCFSIITPSFAQEVLPLRASERDNYSRLTFGWKYGVEYNLDKSTNGLLIITFNHDASIDTDGIDFSTLGNIASVKAISTRPLKLSLIVPKSSDIRDFKIGKRVVLDIYDPKNPDEATSFKHAKKIPIEKTKIKKATIEVKPLLAKDKFKTIEQMPKVPPEFVLVPDNLSETTNPLPKITKQHTPTKPAVNKILKNAVNQENHVISLRSTSSMSVAAFENRAELWMVVGGGSSYVSPSLSSPTPNDFPSFTSMNLEKATAYHLKLPPNINLKMKARGGGFIWDLIMGDKVKEGGDIKTLRSPHGNKLFFPLKYVSDIVDITDDVTGQELKIITVGDAAQFSGAAKSYVDFDILKSTIGMAIAPKVDDLKVEKVNGGIEISRSSGLNLATDKDIKEAHLFIASNDNKSSNNEKPHDGSNDFFKFSEWQLVSAKELHHNKNLLLSGMSGKSDARKVEDLLKLGKMYLSHGRGAEALGFFNYAAMELPGLNDSSEFKALTGVSKALDWKSDAAFLDLRHNDLKNIDEIKYWKSYVLADLGDWHQAASILPDNYAPISNYPDNIGHRLALVLAEINLRDGDLKSAKKLLDLLESQSSHLLSPHKSSLKYLKGEALRQQGSVKLTEEIWGDLSKDKDDLYRTKAGLALTILLANEKKITNKQVIDRLERLRYSWRGDELEAQVDFWLGDAYFKERNYMKGLAIMRDAASVAGDTALGHKIATNMGKTFTDLFSKNKLASVSALDAVSIYEQFSELTPVGSKGDELVQNLAEHLVKADLLGRATKILRHQVDHRLEGSDKLRVAVRLAAIELLDEHPQKAINALVKALDTLPLISDEQEKSKRKHEIRLLRIRAYLQNKQFEKALSLVEKLDPNKNVNRLRADISWQAGYWDDAADAINAVIIDEDISMTRPLNGEQSDMILNRAIALSLDDDRIALANMRAKYNDLMLQTNKSRQFEVITRARNKGTLADRETLLSIVSEVDLFKDFLESYRAPSPPSGH